MDTNVLVSAALFRSSVPRQAFEAALVGGDVLLSQATLDELTEVLNRPKFDKYVTQSERLQLVSLLTEAATLVTITETITACRDPKDNKYLELAVSGQASHLISGDAEQLTL
ncbi:MAG: putative toxin-antitoxin system toxin component, PIN family, partial [Anaerolineae bacterium]